MFTYRTFDSRQVSPHPEIFKKALPSGPTNSKMRLVLVLVYCKLLYVTLDSISLLFFPIDQLHGSTSQIKLQSMIKHRLVWVNFQVIIKDETLLKYQARQIWGYWEISVEKIYIKKMLRWWVCFVVGYIIIVFRLFLKNLWLTKRSDNQWGNIKLFFNIMKSKISHSFFNSHEW